MKNLGSNSEEKVALCNRPSGKNAVRCESEKRKNKQPDLSTRTPSAPPAYKPARAWQGSGALPAGARRREKADGKRSGIERGLRERLPRGVYPAEEAVSHCGRRKGRAQGGKNKERAHHCVTEPHHVRLQALLVEHLDTLTGLSASHTQLPQMPLHLLLQPPPHLPALLQIVPPFPVHLLHCLLAEELLRPTRRL